MFIFFAPLLNWRHIRVTQHRTKTDWATCVDELVHQHFPDAERCVLVEDNLNTHTPVALYETFAPAKARSILDRLELHYIHPSMAVGSIWLRSNSVSSVDNV